MIIRIIQTIIAEIEIDETDREKAIENFNNDLYFDYISTAINDSDDINTDIEFI